LEILEISEVNLSNLERTLRIDTEFYTKENLLIEDFIKKSKYSKLTDLVKVSDGNHMSISEKFVGKGVPYYRGQDIHSFFIEGANPICIDNIAFNLPVMKRSHLKKGDVLLSIVGTIGKLGLVTTNDDATCSCKLAILRPSKIIAEFLSVFLASKYGQSQIKKFTRGAVQMGLILEDFDQLLIPSFDNIFQSKIETLVKNIHSKLEQSKSTYAQAENLLFNAIGMADFSPSNENINIKSFKDSFVATGRLDAEYYQPKYEDYIQQIKSYKNGFKSISDVLTVPIKNGTTPNSVAAGYKTNEHYFVRVEAFQQNLSIDETFFHSLDNEDYLKYKSNLVLKNDILVSMTGTIGAVVIYSPNKPALINQNVMRLRCNENLINTESLAVYLKTIGKVLLERVQTGNVQPYVNTSNFETLIVPLIDLETQTKISNLVQQSFILKAESERLLATAKRAVEIAIETDEQTAMAYINEQTGVQT
jgi:restriction endonuclease S subunit